MALKPKLGQNFLIDPGACIAIADALGDLSERTVVEIGPGAGAITEILSARAKKLVAVELDRELAPRLRGQFADRPSVEVVEADILKVDLRTLRQNDEKLIIVGNLPYYITSDILLRLLEFHSVIDRAVIMVQREVAARIAAVPGTRDYGLLSATVQLYASTEKILTLPPTAFMPPPEVHSTVVRLVMAPRWAELGISAVEESKAKAKFAPPSEVREFIAFLRQSFAQKRKTLAKNLRAAGFNAAGIAEAIEKAGVAPTARAEQLNLNAMAAVFRHLGTVPSPAPIQRLAEPG